MMTPLYPYHGETAILLLAFLNTAVCWPATSLLHSATRQKETAFFVVVNPGGGWNTKGVEH